MSVPRRGAAVLTLPLPVSVLCNKTSFSALHHHSSVWGVSGEWLDLTCGTLELGPWPRALACIQALAFLTCKPLPGAVRPELGEVL